jgi:hypothetical protein
MARIGCGRRTKGFRVFVCEECGATATVCSRHDHGRRYCGKACGKAARARKKREASRRYRRTRQARVNGARRQAEYRARQATQEESRKKVTRHSRVEGAPSGIVDVEARFAALDQAVEATLAQEEAVCCGGHRVVKGPGRRGYVRFPDRGPHERPNRRYWWLSWEMEQRWREAWRKT